MKIPKSLIRSILLLPLCLCLALTLGLAGCASVLAGSDLMAQVKAAEWPKTPEEPSDVFRGSVMDFTWKFFQESALNKGNVLVSPASVYLALAMALNGADQDTRTAMLKLLADQGLSSAELNAACRDWMSLLTKTSDKTRLSISNSIWYRNEFSPDKNYLQKNADFFAASARSLDFNQRAAVDTMNAWVKKSTNGKIETIVDSIDPAVVMYLINAIYFKSDWKTPFITKETANRAFKAPDKSVQVPFMNSQGQRAYLEQGDWQGVLLPYVDERYAMMVAMPKAGENPRTAISKLTGSDLASLLASAQNLTIELALPKFETRYEDSLLNELDQMGMGIAFDPMLADFSQMNAGHLKNLYISEVKHKTYCRVDEKGTEAAAVTSVEIRVTSVPVVNKTLVFDRPFLYGIVDTKTGLPLFLGIMENPAS